MNTRLLSHKEKRELIQRMALAVRGGAAFDAFCASENIGGAALLGHLREMRTFGTKGVTPSLPDAEAGRQPTAAERRAAAEAIDAYAAATGTPRATACQLAGAMGSFFPVAVPIALISLALPWGIMLVIRYAPLRGLAKAALCCLWGGLFNLLMNPAINAFADGVPFALRLPNFGDWATPAVMNANIDFVTTLAVWAVAAALGIASLRQKNFGKSA
ncbi:MAG: hypothetical protein FWF96_02155 [Kiritimatiellaeota bacterium]|nr:hypothetical protein [Kiritimatiellota bacterium]